MKKKYIVRLSTSERASLEEVVKRLSGSSQKVRRAQVLLKADADGPAWTDTRIAEAYGCRRQTVENLRERFATGGFESALESLPRAPRAKLPDGDQEAKLIALRLGAPPAAVGSPFGAAGSLVVLIVWVYYSSLIVFFGAELTQVHAKTAGVEVQPLPSASRIPPQADSETQKVPVRR